MPRFRTCISEKIIAVEIGKVVDHILRLTDNTSFFLLFFFFLFFSSFFLFLAGDEEDGIAFKTESSSGSRDILFSSTSDPMCALA